MFPMHGGFMGRGGAPSGFRYLHDEISGGEAAYSKLQSKASYIGDSVSIPSGGTGYGFVNGIVDFAQIDIDQPINTNARYIDQINLRTIDGQPNSYNKAANDFFYAVGLRASGGGISLASDTPMTLLFVGERLADKAGQIILWELQGTSQAVVGIREVDNKMQMIVRFFGANLITKTSTSVTSNGLKLYIATYDGSQNSSGINIYVNDVVTPLANTVVNNLTTVFTPNVRTNFGGLGNGTNDWNGGSFEGHVWNKVLSQSERETAKQILEQYYTFT